MKVFLYIESPLYCKYIKPVNPKGNLSWMFIGRTDADAEATILWPPDAESRLTRKDPDSGKDWRQEEKGTTEDEINSITDSVDMSLTLPPAQHNWKTADNYAWNQRKKTEQWRREGRLALGPREQHDGGCPGPFCGLIYVPESKLKKVVFLNHQWYRSNLLTSQGTRK